MPFSLQSCLFMLLFSALDYVFSDAVLLNNIVQNFGMLDLVKKVLASHKSQMDRYREQYSRSLVGELNVLLFSLQLA